MTVAQRLDQHDKQIAAIRDLVKEGIHGNRGIGASQEVQIEKVLPGFAAQRAGFNLHQVEIAQGEGAERAEEGSRDVARAEYQRGLPLGVGGGAQRMAACVIGRAQEKKSRKILPVADRKSTRLNSSHLGIS